MLDRCQCSREEDADLSLLELVEQVRPGFRRIRSAVRLVISACSGAQCGGWTAASPGPSSRSSEAGRSSYRSSGAARSSYRSSGAARSSGGGSDAGWSFGGVVGRRAGRAVAVRCCGFKDWCFVVAADGVGHGTIQRGVVVQAHGVAAGDAVLVAGR